MIIMIPIIGADPKEVQKAVRAIETSDFWVTIGILVTIMLGSAIFLNWLQRWRRSQFAENTNAEANRMTSFRSMYEAGELTEEEYQKIKSKIAQKATQGNSLKPTNSMKEKRSPNDQPQINVNKISFAEPLPDDQFVIPESSASNPAQSLNSADPIPPAPALGSSPVPSLGEEKELKSPHSEETGKREI